MVGQESNSRTSADLRVCDSALTWRVRKTGAPGARKNRAPVQDSSEFRTIW